MLFWQGFSRADTSISLFYYSVARAACDEASELGLLIYPFVCSPEKAALEAAS